MTPTVKEKLEYLRMQLQAECISYGELCELQSLAPFIESDDVQLLEAAGVPESEAMQWNFITANQQMQSVIARKIAEAKTKQLRSHFWIKSRKMPNGLIKTHYQSKRYTVVCITVRTLSQWS